LVQAEQRVLELARERGWRIVDLRWYDWKLPPDLKLAGFIAETHALVISPALLKLGCPMVRCGSFAYPEDGRIPAVIADIVAAGRLAAEHFAERNFRHVGYVSYGMGDFDAMHEAFAARAEELGCECHHLRYRTWDAEESALRTDQKKTLRDAELTDWLKSVPTPIGLFMFSDAHAATLCVRCQELGLSIPGDVAVLGNGNSPTVCDCAPVPLSSVDVRMAYRAEVAVRLLEDLMEGKAVPKEAVRVPPTEIVVRDSTDVLATTDPVVARGVQYLWDHCAEELSVEAVAAAVGIPRRTLERAFQDQLGRGVNAELHRRRLERCCELLKTTELSVTDLAPLAGFRSTHYLHVSFRRAYGVSPLEFRRSAQVPKYPSTRNT
jgi:LacI family transcriptional regulator